MSIEGARKLSALCSKIVYKRVRGKTSRRSLPVQNFLEYPPGLHKTLEHQQCKCQRNEKNHLASCPFGKRFPRFSEKSSSPLVARFDIIVSLIVFIKRERVGKILGCAFLTQSILSVSVARLFVGGLSSPVFPRWDI